MRAKIVRKRTSYNESLFVAPEPSRLRKSSRRAAILQQSSAKKYHQKKSKTRSDSAYQVFFCAFLRLNYNRTSIHDQHLIARPDFFVKLYDVEISHEDAASALGLADLGFAVGAVDVNVAFVRIHLSALIHGGL